MWKFAVLLVFFNVLHSGMTLKCYSCRSNDNKNCTFSTVNATVPTETCVSKTPEQQGQKNVFGVPLAFEQRTEEKSDDYLCFMIKGTFKITTNKAEFTVFRGCAPKNLTCEEIEKRAKEHNVTDSTCSTCNKDMCNTGSDLSSSAILGALVLLAFVAATRNLQLRY